MSTTFFIEEMKGGVWLICQASFLHLEVLI